MASGNKNNNGNKGNYKKMSYKPKQGAQNGNSQAAPWYKSPDGKESVKSSDNRNRKPSGKNNRPAQKTASKTVSGRPAGKQGAAPVRDKRQYENRSQNRVPDKNANRVNEELLKKLRREPLLRRKPEKSNWKKKRPRWQSRQPAPRERALRVRAPRAVP